jgi:Tfp pilus assembly protein PilW
MSKKIHFGTHTVSQHMRNAWDRVPQAADADQQAAMDIAHRADVHNANAMAEYERQQMLARMQAKLAAWKAVKYGEWNII